MYTTSYLSSLGLLLRSAYIPRVLRGIFTRSLFGQNSAHRLIKRKSLIANMTYLHSLQLDLLPQLRPRIFRIQLGKLPQDLP